MLQQEGRINNQIFRVEGLIGYFSYTLHAKLPCLLDRYPDLSPFHALNWYHYPISVCYRHRAFQQCPITHEWIHQ